MLEDLKGYAFKSTRSKKEVCRDWKLYVITMPDTDLPQKVRQAVLGGADVVQLRDKDATDEDLTRQARALLEVTRPLGVPLIVNDRVRVAKAAGADGLHLGQEDGRLNAARMILGEDIILGRSTHSPEQVLAAEKEGFDYIGVGPVFETPTKAGRPAVGLELVRFAAQKCHVPFVAIGGIDQNNIRKVREAGAGAVAVVRAVFASDDARQAAGKLKMFLS